MLQRYKCPNQMCGVIHNFIKATQMQYIYFQLENAQNILLLIKLYFPQIIQMLHLKVNQGLSWWLIGKESTWQCRRHRFNAWVPEAPSCHGSKKPVHHSSWVWTLEAGSYSYWAHMPELLKPPSPTASAQQQEKPLQWEDYEPQLKSSSACHN